MNIFNELKNRNRELCLAGVSLHEPFDALIAEYQTRWDRGDRFCWEGVSLLDMFPFGADPSENKKDYAKRDSDSDKELDACLCELSEKLKTMLITNWTKKYDAKQMQHILNALTAMDWNGSLHMFGVTVQYAEIKDVWNGMHPDVAEHIHLSGIESW